MKRVGTALALGLAFGLSACEGRSPAETETRDAGAAAAADSLAPSASAPPPVKAAEAALTADDGSGVPQFAALYPGATLDAPMTTANGPSGPGGMATYTTAAPPEEVVAFYRQRAEEAGLAPMMAMNQGEARAYSAATGSPNGPSIQVVASPAEGGMTSVQLSWSEGA
jgi:hypothetical protein